jgi:hypothetical protein
MYFSYVFYFRMGVHKVQAQIAKEAKNQKYGNDITAVIRKRAIILLPGLLTEQILAEKKKVKERIIKTRNEAALKAEIKIHKAVIAELKRKLRDANKASSSTIKELRNRNKQLEGAAKKVPKKKKQVRVRKKSPVVRVETYRKKYKKRMR